MNKFRLTTAISFFLLLSACTGTELDVLEEAQPSTDVSEVGSEASISYLDHGVELDYPEDWEIQELDTEGVLDLRLSNQTAPDGYSCSEPYVGFYLISTLRDTSVGDFDAWMESHFDEAGSIGKFGTYMNPTTFKGYPAYEVGNFGGESYCDQKGYVIDYGNDHIVEVILEGKEDSPDYDQLSVIMDSLKLTGY